MTTKCQGFTNSESPQLEVLLGDFFIGLWESEEEWIWKFEPFSKLKTIFCKYWALIKIGISMTCVHKEYELKVKMVMWYADGFY